MQGSCLERWKVEVRKVEVKENPLRQRVYRQSTSRGKFSFLENVFIYTECVKHVWDDGTAALTLSQSSTIQRKSCELSNDAPVNVHCICEYVCVTQKLPSDASLLWNEMQCACV